MIRLARLRLRPASVKDAGSRLARWQYLLARTPCGRRRLERIAELDSFARIPAVQDV
jgi:hypothetical protein